MCENTRENLSILWYVFDSTCATRFWWIPQWFKIFGEIIVVAENRRNWQRREERTIAISTFTSLFSESEEKKPGRQKISCVCDWPCRGCWDLCSSGMTIPSYLPSEIHLQKFDDKEEFQSWIVNFQVEVCAKAKNLALVLQWIKRPKQPARWRTPPIQNQLQEKISLITKSWIWWWRQNWHGASIFLIWSTKLPSVEPWKDKRANIFFIEWKTEECFERKTLGSCSRRDACSFLIHTHATGDREDNVGWSGETQRRSHLERASSSVPKVNTQTDVERLNSPKASPAMEAENPLSTVVKMKNIVAQLSTSSRVPWLQVWKQMHSWLSLLVSTWWWEETQREAEKKVLKDQLLFWEDKRPRLCIRRFWSKEFYSTESWRIGIERFGGTHLKFSGCTSYKVEFLKKKKKVIWWPYPKKVNLVSEIRARLILWINHPRKLHYKKILFRNVAWNLARKYVISRPKTTTFHSLVKVSETRKIVCFFWIRELQCTTLSKGELSSDTVDTLRSKNTTCDLPRLGAVQIDEKAHVFWSGSRPVRNSAITRWNASDSVAW